MCRERSNSRCSARPRPRTQNQVINENQKALFGFGQFLEKPIAAVEDKAAVGTRTLRMLRGPQAQFAVAKERFESIIQHAEDGAHQPTLPSSTHTCPDKEGGVSDPSSS